MAKWAGSKKHWVIRGAGTLESPKVLVTMPVSLYNSAHTGRKEYNYRMVENVALSMGFTHAEIVHWNHNTQFERDAEGHKILDRDWSTGKMCGRLSPADAHITCSFRNTARPHEYFTAHVYVVEDKFNVPRQLMPVSERQYTSPTDWDSPQFWQVSLRHIPSYYSEFEDSDCESDPWPEGFGEDAMQWPLSPDIIVLSGDSSDAISV
ncbi:hypothetical protein M406DRAFT_75132 [Cryphonectria parasitica EP155]|uniref:Uncharacterized protein n=1 Tax=Cryphonectria parasitica (strain ATCC 38755 / EP155) TaxID=660469 RepID=A0A9P4Y018_CRYP1|nr:uncharacterized protein M406DRAFT_75132 [Cryphonectria parasitica EP155]KAF3763902.1 hypothetical protein M406DRAFT_75132 [Cryphonectria parasitica EP155]